MVFTVDEGFAYASRLRGSPQDINPPDWVIDWADAPWPFKVYSGGQRIRLGGGLPAWVPEIGQPQGDLAGLGWMLFYAAGCTRVRWTPEGLIQSAPERPLPLNRAAHLSVRRATASGGAMYPAEIYVCTRAIGGLPAALYHYDPAGHELLNLSYSISDQELCEALRIPEPSELRQTVLIITNYFWKNFYKYGDFSYRLGAVDLGVALGRLHRLGALIFGEARAHFGFNDRLVNELLGVEGLDESAYVVLTLGSAGPASRDGLPDRPANADVCGLTVRQRSRVIKRSRDFDAMHRSVVEGGEALIPAPPDCNGTQTDQDHGSVISLPSVGSLSFEDLRGAILRRTSNGDLFTGEAIERVTLAACLQHAQDAIGRLRASTPDTHLPAPDLYCIVLRVVGVAAGAYRYDASTHALVPIRLGSFGAELQATLRIGNINLDLSACIIHVVDRLDFRDHAWGNRAYRVQQMVVGAALDAVMLAASAYGVGSHPLLGFDAVRADRLYALDTTPRGTLAQICVGTVHRGLSLEGSIVS